MKKALLLIHLLSFFSSYVIAQVGDRNINKMNALLQKYGSEQVGTIAYEANYGLVHQTIAGYTDHFTIKSIKKIIVRKVTEGYTVEFRCDTLDPCINHINTNSKGTYLPAVAYSFSQEQAANKFARLAAEIIQADFKTHTVVSYMSNKGDERQTIIENPLNGLVEKRISKEKPQSSHLSINTYNEDGEEDFKKTLSKFGSQFMAIYHAAKEKQWDQVKGAPLNGVHQSNIRLPKAKKNYINKYKKEDCFIAEFGTKKYYEDLQELYDEILDEIEDALPEDYEPVDMAYEKVYENSDDEVFHTEYYHNQDMNMPSIVIRIAPDGKNNTLFLRIGKR